MQSLLKVSFILCFCLFMLAPIASAQTSGDPETSQILAAAKAYALAHSAPEIVDKSDFKVVKRVKDKALVVGSPKVKGIENASIIVKKIGSKWVGETMGDFGVAEGLFRGQKF
jgi:hypothetical protein